MAEVPIRAIQTAEYLPTRQWIASRRWDAQTFHLIDPGNIQPDELGRIIVPSGTPYPANDASCFGLIVNDSDVTVGSSEIAVMLRGIIYEERLPVELSAAAKTALEGKIIPRNGAWL